MLKPISSKYHQIRIKAHEIPILLSAILLYKCECFKRLKAKQSLAGLGMGNSGATTAM